MNENILSIDIGNTVTHIGICIAGLLKCTLTASCKTSRIEQDFIPAIKNVIGQRRVPVKTRAASVAPEVNDLVENLLLSHAPPPLWLHAHDSLPISVEYQGPAGLGADRLANLLYCYHACKGKNSMVIDAGTAVTIDCLSKTGKYSGGAIMPGTGLQTTSLREKTSQLPLINQYPDTWMFPARSTESCICAGVLAGIAGGLNMMADKAVNLFDGDAVILACGGAWESIAAHVSFRHEHIPELTLVGIGLFPDSHL